MNPENHIYQEERPWGMFRQFTHNEKTTVKIISVNPNQTLSLQSHKKRSEFWRVLSGSGTIEIGESKNSATKNSEYYVPSETKHRISAGENGVEILEIAFGEFDESDIVRYEDKYGRA